MKPLNDESKISLLLADDHKIVRQGFRMLLEAEKDFSVIEEAGNGREVIEKAMILKPDIVIMDIDMPEINGIIATQQITSREPSIKVIALSMLTEEEMVDQLIQAGVSGYVVKDSAVDELIKAIRSVAAGHLYFSPAILKIVIEKQRNPKKKSTHLTFREKEVLQLVAQGKTNKEISSILSISVKTVEKFRQQIMDKLNIHDIANLTRYVIMNRIAK